MCSESFAGFRFDLGPLLQGQMWFFIPIMAYISLVIGHRGFGREDESFDGVTFDILFCMSCFNHFLSGDTLHRNAISSFHLEIPFPGS